MTSKGDIQSSFYVGNRNLACMRINHLSQVQCADAAKWDFRTVGAVQPDGGWTFTVQLQGESHGCAESHGQCCVLNCTNPILVTTVRVVRRRHSVSSFG